MNEPKHHPSFAGKALKAFHELLDRDDMNEFAIDELAKKLRSIKKPDPTGLCLRFSFSNSDDTAISVNKLIRDLRMPKTHPNHHYALGCIWLAVENPKDFKCHYF